MRSAISTSEAELERIGHELFGRGTRLLVASAVAGRQDSTFFQGELALDLRLPQSNVREELERLVRLGMVEDVPRESGSSRRYYRRVDHPLWAVIEAAVAATERLRRRR